MIKSLTSFMILLLVSLFFIMCSNEEEPPQNDPTPTPTFTPTPTPDVETFIQYYGGDEPEWGQFVSATIDGGYIILGSTRSYGAGEMDIYLIKTDSSGNEEWYRTFGYENYSDYGYCVQQTTDSGYVISGWMGYNGAIIKTDPMGYEMWYREYENVDGLNSIQETIDGGYITVANGILMMKTDSQGNVLWQKTWTFGLSDNYAHAVIEADDGGYVVTGECEVIPDEPPFTSKIYILKTDSEGNEEWFNILVPGGLHQAWDVKQALDKGYVVVGEKSSDGILIKTDSNGEKEWQKTFGHEYDIRSLQILENGYTLLAQHYDKFDHNSVYRPALLNVGPDGELIWSKIYDQFSNNDAVSNCLDIAQDEGYIFCGDTTINKGDIFLIKTDENGDL